MARWIKSKKVTEWEYCNQKMINSSHGRLMTYEQWCHIEMARLSVASGRRHHFHRKKYGNKAYCCISLSSNIND